jgi:hypothetical protein
MGGDRLAGLRWLADGDVCRGSRVKARAYMVPGLYMPCRMSILEYPESIAISRYKVVIVVDRRKGAQVDLHTHKVGVQGSLAPAIQIQILTDAWNPKKGPTSSMQQR